jgi:hypothetical protein
MQPVLYVVKYRFDIGTAAVLKINGAALRSAIAVMLTASRFLLLFRYRCFVFLLPCVSVAAIVLLLSFQNSKKHSVAFPFCTALLSIVAAHSKVVHCHQFQGSGLTTGALKDVHPILFFNP